MVLQACNRLKGSVLNAKQSSDPESCFATDFSLPKEKEYLNLQRNCNEFLSVKCRKFGIKKSNRYY